MALLFSALLFVFGVSPIAEGRAPLRSRAD